MRKRHWRDAIFFALGTFLGGWVLGVIAKILGKV